MEDKNTTIVGILGPQLAGKATAAQYMSECLLVPQFGIHLPLYEAARSRNVLATPTCLAQLETELIKNHGESYVPEQLLRRMGTLGIIEGLQRFNHVQYLRTRARLVLIGVTAESHVRFDRARRRGRVAEQDDVKSFVEQETIKNSVPGGLDACLEAADYIVTNDLPCQFHLQDQLNKILQKEQLL